MSPAVRRSLVFVVLVSVGLGVVLLVEDDDPTPVHRPAYGKIDQPPEKPVTIRDEASDTETQVTLGEIIKTLSTTVELPDGRLEKREVYRIHILGGSLDDSGDILVDSPRITFLDTETGEDLGSVRADKGRVEGSEGGPVFGVFDLGASQVQEITLTGNVHGEMVFEGEDAPATFDGPELRVDGEDLYAPGDVRLASEAWLVTGSDMSWTGASRQLRFGHIAEIESRGELGAVVHSPEGLEWFAGDGGEQAGRGTLFGPVTGEAADGSRIAGRQLEVDEGAALLTLLGDARVDRPFEGALWTMTADTIAAHRSAEGDWTLSYAEGAVRLSSEDADPPTWFETDRIDGVDGTLVAQGAVRGRHGEFDVAGTGLRWNQASGSLDLLADAVLDFLALDPGAPLRGAHVTSPGGAFLTRGGDGLRARLAGPVGGSIPDMGSFHCAQATFEEVERLVVLDTAARVELVQEDVIRELSSDRIAITLDEAHAPSAVSARGSVVLTERDGMGLQARLASPQLDATEQLATTPEVFELYWKGVGVTGTGLTVDRQQGLFDIARGARVQRILHAGGTEWIEADEGASWWLPDGPEADPATGRGEFRGPVRGETAEGIRIAAEELEVDGARQSARMQGSASVDHPDLGRVESEQLEFVRNPAGLRIRSPVFVSWSSEELSGHGTQLDFDEERGQLSLERDVLMSSTRDDGVVLEISCDGRFTWTAPPGSVDPFEQGVAEFDGNVVARDGVGGGLSADRVVIDKPRNQVELFGEIQLRHLREGKAYELNTEPAGYLRLVADSEGQPVQLDATGRVELVAEEMTLQGDELSWNLAEDHALLSGDCRLNIFGSWMSMPSVEAWPGASRWYIPRNVSKFHADEP